MKIRKEVIILILIFLLAGFLRLYKLGEVPAGLYQDETAIGYNAYSILQTGKDEYGVSWPLYFKSFGDQKLPVYIYATIPSIVFFGLNDFAVRFPSALFGFLTVVIAYFFIRDLTKNKKIAILATLLLAINPWALHYNRATFEVSIGLFLFITGCYLLNLFFQKRLPMAFFFGTFCFILSLYSYNLTRLLSPLLFVAILLYNKQHFKNVRRKELISTGIFSLVALFPFFQTLLDKGGASSASGTLIFSSAVVQAPFHELRWYANNLPNPLDALFFNKYVLIAWQYINNIVAYFSPQFYFISGTSHGNHGIGNVGLFYLFEFPLIVIGMIHVIRKKMQGSFLLFLWAIAVILVAALTRDVPHATRSFFLLLPFVVFSAAGLLVCITWIKRLSSRPLKWIVYTLTIGIIVFNLVYYFTSYYFRFPVVYAKSWRLEDKELSLYLKQHEHEYQKIIFDKSAGFMYTSVLFYSSYSPEEFQKTSVREPDDAEGFSYIKSFGKYEFRDIDWDKDIKREHVLIVTGEKQKPPNIPSKQVFTYPKKYVAFPVSQQVIEYPVEEAAYVLVSPN